MDTFLSLGELLNTGTVKVYLLLSLDKFYRAESPL